MTKTMKLKKLILLTAIMALVFAGIIHCSEEAKADGAYTCPMHPEVKKEKMGECPICGMDLEPLESHGADHKHEDMKEEKK
ncbi:MAG: hypothetical protein OEZ13_09580 [Spirochaetia bacterium]|nr:hypothetical protein [Spirochaetia bacterium]